MRAKPVVRRVKAKIKRATSNLAKRIFPGAVILMYHRVAEIDSDPWSLCVTPKHFAEQLEVVKSYGNAISLSELNSRLRQRQRLRKSIVITFDDGYADNHWNARPLLEKYEIPAIVFVSTGCLGSTEEFWWDELERLLLQPGTLPEELTLEIGGAKYRWALRDAARYSQEEYRKHRCWRIERHKDPTCRHTLYRELYSHLKYLPVEEIKRQLEHMRNWARAGREGRPSNRPLSQDELLDLDSQRLMEIGAHSVTHPFLSRLSVARQQKEILQSKQCLESLLGHPVTSFSYPHGSYVSDTVPLVREAGFECACSSISKRVLLSANRYLLPRLVVQDFPGAIFAEQFASYLRV